MALGNPDSKYAFNPNQLDKDIEAKKNKHESFRKSIRDMIFENPADAALRFRDALDEIKAIQQEYNFLNM